MIHALKNKDVATLSVKQEISDLLSFIGKYRLLSSKAMVPNINIRERQPTEYASLATVVKNLKSTINVKASGTIIRTSPPIAKKVDLEDDIRDEKAVEAEEKADEENIADEEKVALEPVNAPDIDKIYRGMTLKQLRQTSMRERERFPIIQELIDLKTQEAQDRLDREKLLNELKSAEGRDIDQMAPRTELADMPGLQPGSIKQNKQFDQYLSSMYGLKARPELQQFRDTAESAALARAKPSAPTQSQATPMVVSVPLRREDPTKKFFPTDARYAFIDQDPQRTEMVDTEKVAEYTTNKWLSLMLRKR